MPESLNVLYNREHGDDYVYISTYVPGKGHDQLIEAWRLLHRKGVDVKLHLTVPFDCADFNNKVRAAQKEGVKIVNHGIIPFDRVIDLYGQSKAIVYPSHNESLGLGIVEAITAGCDVSGSDLPFIHSICVPSGVFNPYSPNSIADAILKYERGGMVKSKLLIKNQINELIDLIS